MIALSTGHGPLEQAFEYAAQAGISALELACQEPENHPSQFDDARIDRVRGMIDRFDMQCVVHSASAVNSAETDPTVRPAVVRHLLEYVHLTAGLGCDTLIVHGGYHFGLGIDRSLDALHLTLRECAFRAQELGVSLAIENMNVLPEIAEIRYLGCTARDIADIIDAVDSPALGACLDIGHANLLPEGPALFIDTLGRRITYAQLTDNDGVHDDHLALGRGTLDIDGTFRRLTLAGYDGIIGIELHDRADQAESLEHLSSIGLHRPIS